MSTRRRLTACSAPVIAALAAASTAQAAPPNNTYKLAFADEFSGTSLDAMKWGTNYSWGARQHNHSAYMDASQVKVGGGLLNLQAVAQRHPNATNFNHPQFGWQQVDYTSGAIHTAGTFRMDEGYAEARMKMPDSVGSWPAFWMLKDGWPPEIDVMEFPLSSHNSKTQYSNNFHYTNASNANASNYRQYSNQPDLTAGFHTFGVDWDADSMTFYFDGVATRTINDAAAIADAKQMYLILNHAVGGWAGAPPDKSAFPSDFEIDWVRVYQKPTNATTLSAWNGTAASGGWDDNARWDASAPRHEDRVARFGANSNAAVAVAWDNSRTIGGLQFDTATAFSIGDANAGLQFANSGGGSLVDVSAATTAAQIVNARVELYDAVNVSNASAQTLTFNGVITGDGGLTIDGPGTVVFANNNTYAGDTTLDSGTQGPAVARVTRSRPFGTGVVHLGPNGNATTARIEILDGREVPNAINFGGRGSGNLSVGILNVSGSNNVSGTISAQSGGSNYIIQSDAGLLTLSGTGTGATGGVALRVGATGTRTFTLQGAGDGAVTGLVQNGNGTVAIAKAGAGSWTLGADNTYGGATSVRAGTLVVNGKHVGGGAYDVAAGATLGGSGTIDPSGTNAVTVSGRIAPGNSIGTLSVGSAVGGSNDVVIAAGGSLAIEVGAGGNADRLAVVGALDLPSATDELHLLSLPGAFDGSSYAVATFTPGTLGGDVFDRVFLDGVLQSSPQTVMSNNYRLSYDDAGGAIRLTLVPEPASLGVLFASCGLLGFGRPGRRAATRAWRPT